MSLRQEKMDNKFVSQEIYTNTDYPKHWITEDRLLNSKGSKSPKLDNTTKSKSPKASKSPKVSKSPKASNEPKSKNPTTSKSPKSVKKPGIEKSTKSSKSPKSLTTNTTISSYTSPTILTGSQKNNDTVSKESHSPSTAIKASSNPSTSPVTSPTATSNSTVPHFPPPSPTSDPTLPPSTSPTPPSTPFSSTNDTFKPSMISVSPPTSSSPTIFSGNSSSATDNDNLEPNNSPSFPPTDPPTQVPTVQKYGEASDGVIVPCDTVGVKLSPFELVYEIKPELHQEFSLPLFTESTADLLDKEFIEKFSNDEGVTYVKTILVGDVAGTSYKYVDDGKMIIKDVTYTGAVFFCDDSGEAPSAKKLSDIIGNTFNLQSSDVYHYVEKIANTVQLGDTAYSSVTGERSTTSWASQHNTLPFVIIILTVYLFNIIN